MSIGITTFNRPDFCVDQLVKLAEQPDVLGDPRRDLSSSTRAPRRSPTTSCIAAGRRRLSAPKLRLHRAGQPRRLGRLLAVDGRGDRQGRRRLRPAARRRRRLRARGHPARRRRSPTWPSSPTIVGGQMFSLYDRSVMHAYGETVARYRWFWGPAPKHRARPQLRPAGRCARTKWLHRRIDVDYNGWWMCLIPTEVIREIGLSLPMFIKWDDAEFGLRAGEAGFPTVTPARRRRSGTCRGTRRTTRSTGRRTSTAATGSSPRCCTRRTSAAAG